MTQQGLSSASIKAELDATPAAPLGGGGGSAVMLNAETSNKRESIDDGDLVIIKTQRCPRGVVQTIDLTDD